MSKEKVFIVLTHKNSLKPKSQTEWEVTETVEFVSQLRKKHIDYASVIGDYINRKMFTGSRYGMGEYSKFEEYIETKYPKQLAELNAAYRPEQVAPEPKQEVFADEFGNIRARTVFDVA